MFSHLFKMRNAQIISACEELEAGRINEDAFLDRVSFHETNICSNLLSFKNLSVLESEEEIAAMQEIEEEMEGKTNEAEHTVQQKDENNNELCGACVARARNCVLIPCGHVWFCMQCFEEWNSTPTELFDFDLDEGDDVRDIVLDDLQPTVCPYCKTKVTNGIQIRPT